jgi:hypothetical protein
VALPRIDVAIVAVIAAGMLWIEHGHRIVVATPAAVDAAQSAASLCPDTDDVPFSTDCIKFIDGGVLPDIHSRKNAAVSRPVAASDVHGHDGLHVPACPPSNENAPYSEACIKFISGWYWQADSAEDASD